MKKSRQNSNKPISLKKTIITSVFGDKIDEELQRRLREDIDYVGSFHYGRNEIKYNIKSKCGINFNDAKIDSKKTAGFFQNRKNESLFYQYWIMDKTRPLVFFIHGNAENSTTHPFFLYNLLFQKYNLFVFDQIGYGDSDGIRGSLDNFNDYIDNIDDFINFARNSNNLYKNDIYLAGFSTGALEVLYYYIFKDKKHSKEVYNNTKKIFLFSSFFKPHRRLINFPAEIFLIIFSRFFGKDRLIKQVKQKTILESDEEFYIQTYKNLTDNADFLKRRKSDTRIYKVNSNRWISRIILAQIRLFIRILFNRKSAAKDIRNLKVYFYVSENDFVVDNRQTLKIAKLLNLQNNVVISKNAFHDFMDYEDERGANFYSDLNKKLQD
ncbi:MAG TPA: alpha/beta fold hydrolase [Spirochaetota bacterium]|jgi:alpha-beta hydrolase superfamily lysophospholipase|nr:MAG: putative lysophospholipase [Spirochaetes bacterium ADurb.Bin133]HPY86847.1 alpha/beta fold hydrolase [Spirochaetota bacterium]